MLRTSRPSGPYMLGIKISSTPKEYDPIMYAAFNANTTIRKILELLLISCLDAIETESRSTGKSSREIIRTDLRIGNRKSWLARLRDKWRKVDTTKTDTDEYLTHTLFLEKHYYEYLTEASRGLAAPETIAVMIIEQIVCNSYSWATKRNPPCREDQRVVYAGMELVNYIKEHGR